MDYFGLIKADKKYSNKKSKKNCLKFKHIILCFIFFSNIFIIFLIYDLKININQLNPKSLILNNNKSNISNDKINLKDNIVEQAFNEQKNFCENPNKYLIQEYENMIKLTDYSFKSISSKCMYIVKMIVI